MNYTNLKWQNGNIATLTRWEYVGDIDSDSTKAVHLFIEGHVTYSEILIVECGGWEVVKWSNALENFQDTIPFNTFEEAYDYVTKLVGFKPEIFRLDDEVENEKLRVSIFGE